MKYKCMKKDCKCNSTCFLEYYSPKTKELSHLFLCDKHQIEIGTIITDYLESNCMMYWDVGSEKNERNTD